MGLRLLVCCLCAWTALSCQRGQPVAAAPDAGPLGPKVPMVRPRGAPPTPGATRDSLLLVEMVSAGQSSNAQALLEAGADPNGRDERDRTALHAFFSPTNWKLDQKLLHLLLSRGADLTAQDSEGRTPLHLAAVRGAAEMVDLLLAQGADLGARDDRGRTPLHLAAAAGRESVARLLLGRGSPVDARDRDGRTPLHLTEQSGLHGIGRLLLAFDANPALEDLDGHRSLAWVARLCLEALRRSSDPGDLCLQKSSLRDATLPLTAAIGETGLVRRLLSAGADPRAHHSLSPEWGPAATALHAAAAADQPEVIAILSTAGAELDAADGIGWTPLQRAAWRDRAAAVRALLAAGADPQRKTRDGQTACDLARARAGEEVRRLLCQQKR